MVPGQNDLCSSGERQMNQFQRAGNAGPPATIALDEGNYAAKFGRKGQRSAKSAESTAGGLGSFHARE
jgi:hypothetical protein